MSAPAVSFHADALATAIAREQCDEVQRLMRRWSVNFAKEVLEHVVHGSVTTLMGVCFQDSSLNMLQLVVSEIERIGGSELLRHHLTLGQDDGGGSHALFRLLEHCSFVAGIQFLLLKITQVGDDEFVRGQLERVSTGNTCLWKLCSNKRATTEMFFFVCSFLYERGLFVNQYQSIPLNMRNMLKAAHEIDRSWTPDMIDFIALRNAIYKNQHSKIQELLKNSAEAKKIVDSAFRYFNYDSIIMVSLSGRTTTIQTLKLLFSEIKRIGGGDQYLKEILSKENSAGETSLLCACSRHTDSERVELFLNTIEEVGGEEFLADQISKKSRLNEDQERFTCLYALCLYAPEYRSLSLLVGKFFELEALGRRSLRYFLRTSPCFECIFSRRLDSADDMKFLFLLASLQSITGLFEEKYKYFNRDQRDYLRRICMIESGEWKRSDMARQIDMIGDIKKLLIKEDSSK